MVSITMGCERSLRFRAQLIERETPGVQRIRSFTTSARKNFGAQISILLTEKTKQVGVYFSEIESQGVQRYVPRSTQIDLEAGVCNRVRSNLLAQGSF